MIVDGIKRSTKTKDLVKELLEAGFEKNRVTSHVIYRHPNGQIAILSRQSEVSPGVVRKIYKAIKESQC